MVGSAMAISGNGDSEGYKDRSEMAWQQRALRVVDLVPELDYVSRFYEKMLSPLRLYPARMKPNGQLEEIKAGPPVDILRRIRDPGGGTSQLLSSYGRLMLITGEANLFGYNLDEPNERWLFVWNDELKVELGPGDSVKKITWTPASGAEPREFSSEQAVVYKFWSPHPRRSGEASSPMRAIVEGDIAEELIALTKSVRSTATSRAVRGILIIPQEIAPPPPGQGGDDDEQTSWLTPIAEHMEAQIERAGDPAAAAPYLMDPPYEWADRIRLLELHNPQHDYLEKELRKEAVERIARGIDFPPEALLGIGSTNHWAAMQILMDMWRSHGAPMARRLCSDLTTVYLQPALEEEGYAGWAETTVAFDASEVTTKPDRSDDVAIALREGVIGPTGARKMLNIPEEYAPTEAEKAERARNRRPVAAPAPRRDPVADGPEQPGPEGDSGRRTRTTTAIETNGRRMNVMDLALVRCRELAGIRIKQKAQRHFPNQLDLIESVPLCDVAAVMGREMLRTMGLANSIWLVSGGADGLRAMLRKFSFGEEQANLFAEAVEATAARTLYEMDFSELDAHFTQLASQLEAA